MVKARDPAQRAVYFPIAFAIVGASYIIMELNAKAPDLAVRFYADGSA